MFRSIRLLPVLLVFSILSFHSESLALNKPLKIKKDTKLWQIEIGNKGKKAVISCLEEKNTVYPGTIKDSYFIPKAYSDKIKINKLKEQIKTAEAEELDILAISVLKLKLKKKKSKIKEEMKLQQNACGSNTLSNKTPTSTPTQTPVPPVSPKATDINVTAYPGIEVMIPLYADDPDQKSLQFKIESQPASGSLTNVVGSEYRYVANKDFNGKDSFKFSVKNAQLSSDVRTVFINVIPVSNAQNFPIAFLSYPRAGDGKGLFKSAMIDENGSIYRIHQGTDLMIFKPDGTEELLVKGYQEEKGLYGIYDFTVSNDGKSIFYSHVRYFSDLHGSWSDIFKINLQTKETIQLTNSREEFVPPRGALKYASALPKNTEERNNYFAASINTGTVWNVSPAEAGDGSIVFTSNRDNYQPPASVTIVPAMLLYKMDADGKNVQKIGSLSLGGASHPTISKSGRVYYASGEQQGWRAGGGDNWVIWSINPDGTDWQPEISAIGANLGASNPVIPDPFHFQTETSDGTLVVQKYYDTRLHGVALAIPKHVPTKDEPTKFGSMYPRKNPYWLETVRDPNHYYRPFQRRGIYNLTPWSSSHDDQLQLYDGTYPGIVSHPAAIPLNGAMLVWTGDRGDNNSDLGIYKIPDVKNPPATHLELKANLVLNKPDRHEFFPRAVVPFSYIYGIDKPPVPTGKKSASLPKGSPFGVIGTSTMNYREILLRPDSEANESHALTFPDEEIEYLRVIAFNPTLAISTYAFKRYSFENTLNSNILGAEGYDSAFLERTGFFEKLIPLKKYRKADGTIHYGPNPPAGSSPILDPEGKPDTSFQAEIPADQVWTFQLLNAKEESITTAMTWHQVRPGEQRTDCQGCHAHNKPSPFTFEQSFAAQSEYKKERLEYVKFVEYLRDVKPIVDKYQFSWNDKIWRFPSSDGTVPKTPAYSSRWATIDDDPRLTVTEAKTIRAWIDTGLMSAGSFMACPNPHGCTQFSQILPQHNTGPYADTTKPTLHVEVGNNQILIGAFDAHTKLNLSSLTVKSSVAIAGRAAGTELADLFSFNPAEWIWTLNTALPAGGGTLTVSIKDNQVAYDRNGAIWSDIGNTSTRIINFK